MIIPLGGGTKDAFAAIGVVYPAGSVCTCTNGEKTLTASDTSGRFVFAVPSVGTWVVTCTDGTEDNVASKEVVITYAGQTASMTLRYEFLLYTIGDTFDEITGGWSKSDISYPSDSHKLGTVSIGDDGIYLKTTVNSTKTIIAPIGTVNKIDLTNFSKVRATVASVKGSLLLCVGSEKKYHSGDSKAHATIKSAGVHELDISKVNGSYYVWFTIGSWENAYNATITEVELVE